MSSCLVLCARSAPAKCADASGVAVRSQDGTTGGRKFYGTDYSRPQAGKSHLASFTLPRRVTRTTLFRWLGDIALSEGQVVAINSYFDRYIATDAQKREKWFKPLWNDDGNARRRDLDTVTRAFLRVELFEKREQAVRIVKRVEDELFYAIEQILADEQMPGFELATLRRTRRATGIDGGLESLTGGSMIDLWDSVRQLRAFDGEAILEDDQLKALLGEYERTLTRMYQHRYDLLDRWNIDARRRSAERVAQGMRSEEADRREQKWLDESREVTFDIGRLNGRYVDLLSEHIVEGYAQQFVQFYLEQAYPLAYPHPYGIDEIIKAIGEFDTLEDRRRAKILQISNDVALLQKVVSDKMAQAMFDRLESGDIFHRQELRPTGLKLTTEEYEQQLDRWNDQRKQAAEDGISAICDAVGEEIAVQLEPVIAAFRTEYRQYKPEGGGAFYSPAVKRDLASARSRPHRYRRIERGEDDG